MAEIIYLDRDNRIDLLLKADDVAVDLSGVTQIDLIINGVTYSSTDAAAGIITWAQAGYDTGEIRMALGDQELTAASKPYQATLIVYDVSNPNGIVWGSLSVMVKEGI